MQVENKNENKISQKIQDTCHVAPMFPSIVLGSDVGPVTVLI